MRINSIIIRGVSAGILALSATNSLAADGKVSFNGSISDTTCTIAPSFKDMTVNLGDFSKMILDGGVGKTTTPKSFAIKLQDCPESVIGKPLSIIFDGVSANNDNTALKLTQDSGVATGVGIQITRVGNVVPLYTPVDAGVISGKEYMPLFNASYVSLANTVTAGPANSTSNFTIVYN